MTYWNYRVTVQHLEDGDAYTMREVYYDEDDTVTGWNKRPVAPAGENLSELVTDVARMSRTATDTLSGAITVLEIPSD